MAGVMLQNVSKRYGEIEVVHDVNLEIKDKEFVVLVGPSGCGKSTTLRMVAGLEEISGGDMYIDQKRINDMAPKDRDIAMVFQNYALYPHMNVAENMAFGLKMRKFNKEEIHKRVKEAAQILDLTQLLERKPKDLSGGQRQRVALGRAIVREPRVFLMDEPLSNLDAKLRVQMRTEISKLTKRLEITTVYVTHDQTEAMTMGDRLVVMKDGYIQQTATPDEIYYHPRNIFVAGFIGSPAMNFMLGMLQEVNSDVCFVLNGIEWKLTPNQASKVRALEYIGKEVTLGIRPEHILSSFGTETMAGLHNIFRTNIEVHENTGAEVYLHCTGFCGKMITVKAAGGIKPQIGDSVTLGIDMNWAHFFDTTTEQNILLAQ